MTIFEIDAAIAAAIEAAFSQTDTDTGEVSELFDPAVIETLQAERDAKIEGIAVVIKSISGEATAIETEIKALKKRLEAKRNRVQRLTDFLSEYLKSANVDRFETGKIALSFRRSQAVNITDVNLIPEGFIKTKVESAPDKVAIRAALKAGEIIPGAEIAENVTLQIK